MKQRISTFLTVEFDDSTLQADVEEAATDAIKNMNTALMLLPAVKGKSKSGKTVSFKVKSVERAP
jgi:hypothetical protein